MSYARTILNAVKAQLQTIPGLPPVKHRSRPIFWRDEKRVVLLSLVSDELEWELFKADDEASRVCNVKYTVNVTIMVQLNEQYDESPIEVLDWREQIRQKLYMPMADGLVSLPGAPTVWNCQLGLGDVWELAAFDRAFDVSPMTFVFHSKEPVNE